MDSPLGSYLRHVTIRGGEKHLTTGISTLNRRTHPWLRSLHVHYDTSASRRRTAIVSSNQTQRLIARSFAELLTQIRIAVKKKHFVVGKRGIEEHPKHSGWTGGWARALEPAKPKQRTEKKPRKKPTSKRQPRRSR